MGGKGSGRRLGSSDGKSRSRINREALRRMEQTNLFQEAERQKEIGIARAESGADVNWLNAAHECLVAMAQTRESFSAWEITKTLRDLKIETPNERAMGTVLLKAAKCGLIEKTSLHKPNPLAHNCPSPVWRSKVYGQ